MKRRHQIAAAAAFLAALLFLGACLSSDHATEGPGEPDVITVSDHAVPAAKPEARILGHVGEAVYEEGNAPKITLPTIRGTEEAVLTYAPEVPPVITRNHAARVIVNMEVVETVKELADGVSYAFWTFGGEAPGPFIRVREGDLVEFHLHNHPKNQLPHNIDLHAVTGTGGGAEASLIVPGKSATFGFRALKPGLYMYHCATAPVGLHVANGMYGLILVQPTEGMPPVDREYYVMQSEFYTKGGFAEKGLQPFSLEKALAETPDYVVFNGGVNALTGANALESAVGETVRLYIGNAGPNLTSSFHVIGEMFDKVYTEGGTVANQQNVQTTLVPAGGSAIVDFKIDVPGTYTLVDHALFRAFNKGAVGILNAVGPENHAIYTGPMQQKDYKPASGNVTAARPN